MSHPCIHGFQPAQCASCHDVERRSAAPGEAEGHAEERAGWEIFYEPAVAGWRLRAPESRVPPDSYRSLFLARKAVDRLTANPPPAPAAKRGK